MTENVHRNRWHNLAVDFRREVNHVGLARRSLTADANPSVLQLYDGIVTNSSIRDVSRALLRDGYCARAVEEAFKCLNNAVKRKSGLSTDGADLMRTAFSAKSPTLRFSDLSSTSKKNEQLGYMDIFAGSMTGIRNPRAHDHQLKDDPGMALQLLILANHLMEKLDAAYVRQENQ